MIVFAYTYLPLQVYLLKPLPRRSPAWYHFGYAKMVDEFTRVTSAAIVGVQPLVGFEVAEVGPDGLWLTTDSWQKLLTYIFDETGTRAQVIFCGGLLKFASVLITLL
jgi:hypothetical protein